MAYLPIRNSAQLCPRTVRFQRRRAPADLDDVVMEFWQYEVPDGARVPIQVFPSACVVLRFDIRPGTVESILYPPSVSPRMKSVFQGGTCYFGAALRVGRAFPILGVGLDELDARRLSLHGVLPTSLPSLEERLHGAGSFAARCGLLAGFLRAVRRADPRHAQDFARTLGDPTHPFDRVDRVDRVDRTRRRRYRRYVGHGAKELERVLRVQAAMSRICITNDTLDRVALCAGFADQPHLNREFKRILGMTPGAFRSGVGRFDDPDLPVWDDVRALVGPAAGQLRGASSKIQREPEDTASSGISAPPAYFRESSASTGATSGPSWIRTRVRS